MELKEIMGTFAAELGLEALEPDADGFFHLAVDEMTVSFAELKDAGQLLTLAEVCEPPPATQSRLYRMLMEAMHMGAATGGAMFSVAPDGEKIFLQRFDALAALDCDGFKAMLEKFVNVLEEWRQAVAAFRDIEPVLDDAKKESDAALRQFGLGAEGMIRG